MEQTTEKMIVEESAKMITADEDFKLPNQEMKKLDIACGMQKQEGFIGIDKVKTDQTDIVHDLLQFPWPIEDASIWEAHCSHFVEHIPIQIPKVIIDKGCFMGIEYEYGLFKFMEELYRIMMMGGLVTIVAPYYTSIRAWQDPTHTRAITDLTFDYFSKGKIGGVDHYVPKCNFEVVHRRYVLNKELEALGDEARAWALRHNYNVVDDIQFTLRKVQL